MIELVPVALCVLLGAAVGSFLNVVVWRVPRGESVVRPRSACPRCATPIAPRDNLPVVSWLLLRGRCRSCSEPIAVRYPVVEGLTAVLFGLVAWYVGPSWALPLHLYVVTIAIALAIIDVEHRRLPDVIVLRSYPVVALLAALAAWAPGGTAHWDALARAGMGALGLGALYFVLWFVYPAGMGFGDVKLAVILGAYLAWHGWGTLAVGAFGAFLLGGLFGVVLMALGRAGRKSTVPFGPWMLLSALLAVPFAPAVVRWYLGLMGLADA